MDTSSDDKIFSWRWSIRW